MLAGKEYEVPTLVPRQLRHVLPALLRAVPSMARFAEAAKEKKIFDQAFPVDAYDDMLTVIYWGVIWPNDKTAAIDTVDDIPLSFSELTNAALAVQFQTGLFNKASEGAEPGEETAAPLKTSLPA